MSKKKTETVYKVSSPKKKNKDHKVGSVPAPFTDKSEVYIEDGKIYIKK